MTRPIPLGHVALAASLSMLACVIGSPAQADPALTPVTFNLGTYSQYLFRGLTQTSRRAALQAGADWSAESGPYAGAWLSNVSWFSDANPGTRSPIELDVYGGYRRSLGGEIGVDVGVTRYAYPGRFGVLPAGSTSPNMTELSLAASWHGATLKYSSAVSNANGVEHSVGSSYLDFTATLPIANTVSATLHVGRQIVRGQTRLTTSPGATNDALYSYTDISAGLVATFRKSWSASVIVTTTTASDAGYLVQGRNLGGPQLAAGLVRTF